MAKEIEAAGGKALAVTTDVSRAGFDRRDDRGDQERFGRIDILIDDARDVLDADEMRPFDQIMKESGAGAAGECNRAVSLLARGIAGDKRRVKWGRIINMASGAVTMGRRNYLHYIASKGALAGMTGSMARELGPDGIAVNAILPGATFTEIERKTVSPEQKVRIIAQQCIPRAETPDDLVGARVLRLQFIRLPDRAMPDGRWRRHVSMISRRPS